MTARPAPTPWFPGGMDTAPELAPGGGCRHEPCLCAVEPGKAYCCLACARGSAADEECACGHFGCTGRVL